MGRKAVFEEKIFIKYASVAPDKVNFFSRPIDGFQRTGRFVDNMKWLDDNEHEGLLSRKTRKKIEKAVTWLLFMSKPQRYYSEFDLKNYSMRLNFITLTLPVKQMHSDQEIKDRCLNNFLQVLRNNKITNYVWRAEAQPFTNNIHFHITTDKYIHYNNVRKWWNQSLNLLGYIEEFEMKWKHRNPNSTDIHKVKHVKKLASYISKYIGKNRSFPCIGELRLVKDELKEITYNSIDYKKEAPELKAGKLVGHMIGTKIRPIEGRLWGCSSSINRCKNISFSEDTGNIRQLYEFCDQSNFRLVRGEYCDTYYGKVTSEAKEWFPDLYKMLKQNPFPSKTIS